MTVGEKLITIADNTPIVCNAVESSKKEVNGNVIVANDISSMEHPVVVMLTNDSETPTDFSGVTVKQNGKNQADIMGWTYYAENCISSETEKDGDSITAKGNEGSSGMAYSSGNLRLRFRRENGKDISLPTANQTITVSLYVTLLEQGIHDRRIGIYACTESTSGSGGRADFTLNVGERTKLSFTRTPTVDITALIVRLNNNKAKIEMDTLQIEYGYEATDFEAYKTPVTYTANADGTVDGIKSLAPSMVLVCSDKEAILNCRYFPVEADWKRNTLNEIAQELEKAKEYLPK